MNIQISPMLLSEEERIERKKRLLLNTILRNDKHHVKKESKDTYMPDENAGLIDKIGIYGNSAEKKTNYISEELLYTINSLSEQITTIGNGLHKCGGVYFTTDQIPRIDVDSLKEVKAENNVIDFGSKGYFKYVSSDGRSHGLCVRSHSISGLYGETLRGAPHDETLQRYAGFWSYLASAKRYVYLSMSYPRTEIVNHLKEAGIEPGFFTLNMGEETRKCFYSTGQYGAILYSQEEYDELYQAYRTKDFLYGYEPGTIFTIGGKEYTVSEDHTLDLPYGADLFDLVGPSNYVYGVKGE